MRLAAASWPPTAPRSSRWPAPCPPLIDELVDLGFAPLDPDATVAEIRVAQAQLFGWLNGLILSDERFSTPPEPPARDVRP
jgi:hypothetical protein